MANGTPITSDNIDKPMMQKPVRPRDAASLIVVDSSGPEPRVLMGKRLARASFIPSAYVFPGGALDRADFGIEPVSRLAPHHIEQLGGPFGPARAHGLANAALRETYEETGLMCGFRIPAVPARANGSSSLWAQARQTAVRPDHSCLSLLGRAITPTASPKRFHARFFVISRRDASGTIGGSGELTDIDFYPLGEALKLPIIDVTEFMLNELANRLQNTRYPEPAGRGPVAMMTYRGQKPLIKYL